MARRRKRRTDDKLPDYVYLKKGRYVHVEYLGRGPDGKYRLGHETRLCSSSASLAEVWLAYESKVLSTSRNTVKYVVDRYLESEVASSKKDYSERKRLLEAFCEYKVRDGSLGEANIHRLTTPIIQRWLDKHSSTPYSGNRTVAYLSAAWSWNYRRFEDFPANPCRGVQRLPESRRSHYVTDENYNAIYNLAVGIKAPSYIPIFMEFAYLCRLRKAEVFDLRDTDVVEKVGIYARRLKGSRDNVTRWSPRLKAVYRACVKLPYESNVVAVFKDDKGRPFRYLIHDKRGNPIRLSSFDSAWRRLMKKAVERDIEPFRAHDLKRKGTTDTKGTRADKQEAGGWRNESMVDVYDVSVPQVDPTR